MSARFTSPSAIYNFSIGTSTNKISFDVDDTPCPIESFVTSNTSKLSNFVDVGGITGYTKLTMNRPIIFDITYNLSASLTFTTGVSPLNSQVFNYMGGVISNATLNSPFNINIVNYKKRVIGYQSGAFASFDVNKIGNFNTVYTGNFLNSVLRIFSGSVKVLPLGFFGTKP